MQSRDSLTPKEFSFVAKMDLHRSSLEISREESRCRAKPSENVLRSEFESLLSESSDDEDERSQVDRAIVTSGAFTSKEQGRVTTSETLVGSQEMAKDVSEEIVLSVIWWKNSVGAAYYDVGRSELYAMEDLKEETDRFDATRALYRECRPRYLVTVAGGSSVFANLLKELIIGEDSRDEAANRPSLRILSAREHGYERSYHRARCLRLRYEPRDLTGRERFAFLGTLVNFKHRAMIHALGSLLLFLDQNWNAIALLPTGEPSFLSLERFTLRDLVAVDEDAYKALNILRPEIHPSLFEIGYENAPPRGFCLFSFLNRCRSRLGAHFLWKLLHRPTRDPAVLEERLNAVEFLIDPESRGIVDKVSSALRDLRRPSGAILGSDSGSRARPSDWWKLHKTVSRLIDVADACESHAEKIGLFRRICDSVTDETRYVKYFLEYAIDFETGRRENVFAVKPNVDPLLDELTHAKAALPTLLTEIAQRDMRQHLPNSVRGCSMVYLPNIGYLLAINDCHPEPPNGPSFPGLEFKFTINGSRYYKSPSARELDDTIGDVILKIAKRKSLILSKLTRYVNKHIEPILRGTRLCAELDTMLAFAVVARDHEYVRPRILRSRILEVKEGRHPLQECLTSFVPNDIRCGGETALLKIVTGPNSCGKSVYLKQIGLIVFMAHLGSYVPARSATIGLVDRIFTQMPNTGSIVLSASSFLLDLRQINLAMRASTADSLVLIDEFGRGTSETSGRSLLAAVLDEFAERGKERCPRVFASTHIHSVAASAAWGAIVETQTFEYLVNEDESLSFLFRVIGGNATRSFAHSDARSVGLDEDVVRRSLEIYERIKRGEAPLPLPDSELIGRASTILERAIAVNTEQSRVELEELRSCVQEAAAAAASREK